MSLGRSSAIIAAGTLASRVTGLLRSMVLVAAIGAFGLANDAFYTANILPNYVFQVISTGVITAVFVPLIVRWSTAEDGGQRQLSKLFTLGTVVMLGVTAVALVAAPLLVSLFSHYSGPQFDLAVAFALWCLPQVFFYGMFALIGETLNARRVFGPYAWTPIVNNIVSIAGFLVFIAIYGGGSMPIEEWDPGSIALLGGTATAGIVAQTIALVIFWRKTGLHLRPDFRWRGMGLGEVRRVATWSIAMLLVGYVVTAVQQQMISTASGENASVTVWQNAWLVFMLPYSLIVMSIGTPYFTRMSEHAAAGRDADVRSDIGTSTRVLGMLIVISAVTLMAAAVPLSRLFATNTAEAEGTATVLIGFLFGLVPMAVLFIIQRAFYAYGDTRTPFFFTAFQAALAVAGALAARALLGDAWVTAGIAFSQAVASLAQVILASWLLRRHLGPLGMLPNVWAIGRFTAAALPAGAAGYAVYLWTGGPGGWMLSGLAGAVAGCVVIGLVCSVIYAALLAVFRAPELSAVTATLRARLPRR
ncbi:murein biosynthesis integral membrane protein MurJ [Microbacterium excoecariae]|uniref:murein biosynthesis integral membrane protein MurJ n=1 Tax=Microbacterium excoecariae TaxID=2715210 RepID=UPI00140E36EB|nr:murein biosynthesis integral membrane protein MurJ [Microbacterium excoecariae]NHI15867.1 murein biosynthesis integral membrane protein MurJ [Microbacterium excoecariae]